MRFHEARTGIRDSYVMPWLTFAMLSCVVGLSRTIEQMVFHQFQGGAVPAQQRYTIIYGADLMQEHSSRDMRRRVSCFLPVGIMQSVGSRGVVPHM